MAGSADLKFVESVALVNQSSGEQRTFTVGAMVRPLTVGELKEKNKGRCRSLSSELEHKMTFGDLGQGPHRVGKIGLWPCGGVTIYLDPSGEGCTSFSLVIL